jgi:hypothetical protein
LLGLVEEQKETIKAKDFLVYFPHFTPTHDSLPDEKLFENTQKNLPRYADIWNYLFVGKIILFVLREENIGASNLNLRVREH